MSNIVEEWIGTHDTEDYCGYCEFGHYCTGMSHGPNGPVYPPCSEKPIKDILDLERIAADLESE